MEDLHESGTPFDPPSDFFDKSADEEYYQELNDDMMAESYHDSSMEENQEYEEYDVSAESHPFSIGREDPSMENDRDRDRGGVVSQDDNSAQNNNVEEDNIAVNSTSMQDASTDEEDTDGYEEDIPIPRFDEEDPTLHYGLLYPTQIPFSGCSGKSNRNGRGMEDGEAYLNINLPIDDSMAPPEEQGQGQKGGKEKKGNDDVEDVSDLNMDMDFDIGDIDEIELPDNDDYGASFQNLQESQPPPPSEEDDFGEHMELPVSDMSSGFAGSSPSQTQGIQEKPEFDPTLLLTRKQKPQDLEAEGYLLGIMLNDRDAVEYVTSRLSEEDFCSKAHKLIYKAMMELFEKNEVVDIITVMSVLQKNKNLEKVGGRAYIISLSNKTIIGMDEKNNPITVSSSAGVLSEDHLESYIHILQEKTKRRSLLLSASKIALLALDEKEEIENILVNSEKEIFHVTSTSKSKDNISSMKELMLESFDYINELSNNGGKPTGLATAFTDLDRMTSGFQNDDFIIIAARPSMGKTAFVLNIASNIALRKDKSVAIFSLEMSKEQLARRLLSAESRVNIPLATASGIKEEEWDRLLKSAEDLSKSKILIDDTGGITVHELASRARKIKAEHGLDLIIIDYLQLMQGKQVRKSDNRQQEISDISRSLKALARELHIPVIALSQLSRGVESRQVKKPMLSDLRESGSLEQDADVVIFLYREDYYDEETENKNLTDVIIAKQRNGAVGSIQLYFQKEFTRFVNLAREKT